MQILHVITSINRGGAENHLIELVRQQIYAGHSVTVAYLKGNGYWKRDLNQIGVDVVPLGLKRYGDVKPLLTLRKQISAIQPDIVHAHLPPAELYTYLALAGHKAIPFIISKHNDEDFYRGPGQRLLGKLVASRANHIIAISNSVKQNVCRQALGVPSCKTTTIYYGIDIVPYQSVSQKDVEALRAEWLDESSTYLVGTVARLVPQKAIHVLLEGFSLYLKRTHIKSKLVIVGQGDLENQLKQQAQALKLQEHIIWAGYREDIPTIMSALDVFVLTSLYEGLGLVLLEAMAAEKPIVASNVSAIPEIVEDKNSGLLVTPGKIEELAKALDFFSVVANRNKFGTTGLKLAQSKFTLKTMALHTQQLYEQVYQVYVDESSADR